MKNLILLLIITCVNNIIAQTTNEVLYNTSVINLYSKGLSSMIIVSKIKTSKSNFDVSIDALIKLKNQKIPDDVVNAMVEASISNSAISTADPNNPLSPHESGIYFELNTSHKELMELEPTVCSQGNTNAAAQIFVSSLINSKNTVTISGSEARFQIDATNSSKPVFYFYFDPGKTSLNSGTVSFAFQNASSPNEFMLIKTKVKNNSREFVTGKQNLVSSHSGIDNKSVIDFDMVKLSPGIYKVIPKEELIHGEYCWMYAGHTPKDQGAKVFDFGIK